MAGASGLSSAQSAMLLQSAMIIAGIGTLIQLFPLWKIGSGLVVGYIVAIAMGVVDFSALQGTSIIALPRLMPYSADVH